jgi:hypothetical protein
MYSPPEGGCAAPAEHRRTTGITGGRRQERHSELTDSKTKAKLQSSMQAVVVYFVDIVATRRSRHQTCSGRDAQRRDGT